MTKRIAFFAHYDPDGIVADYVVYYLSRLLDAGVDSVYFSSDSDVTGDELSKLPDKTKVVNASRHGEYDFGSWKRCFSAYEKEYGPEGLPKLDELVLCNDSCYGPLFSLQPMFSAMEQKTCDYWGITQVEYSEGYKPSFFLVMRKAVLRDTEFFGFMVSIKTFTDKRDYCEQYEIGLNRFLEGKGYKGACYLDEYVHLCHSSSLALSDEVFCGGMPFIRVMTAKKNPGGIARLGERIRAICTDYGYPLDLIRGHLLRVSPGFEKYWRYQYGDINHRCGRIVRIRQKPNPVKDRVRIKVWIFGIPVFYCTFPMKYVEDEVYGPVDVLKK